MKGTAAKWVSFAVSVFVLTLGPTNAFTQTNGEIRYSTNILEYWNGISWTSTDVADTGVSCSTASPGEIRFNTAPDPDRMEFCNGTNWRRMDGTVTAETCTTAGEIEFKVPGNQIRFCNGGNWVQAFADGNIDPYLANVVLLIQPQATDTSVLDYSLSQHTVTPTNGAALSTAVSDPWGGSRKVVAFDGNNDYLSIPDSGDWAMGTGDFTFEFWTYFNSLSAATNHTFFSQWESGSSLMHGQVANAGNWGLLVQMNGSSLGAEEASDRTTPTGSWNHYAFVRDGNNIRIFLNGTQVATRSDSGTASDVAAALAIGSYSGSGTIDGYIGAVRITKGVARYTGNFTPSMQPFPVPPDTTPDAFDFTDVYGAATSTSYQVAAAVTGFDGPLTATVTQGDTYANNVVLLIQPGAIDSSILDYSQSGHTINPINGAALSTAVSDPWGGNRKVILADGNDDRLIIPDSPDWDLTGDFTIEYWVYFNLNDGSKDSTLIEQYEAGAKNYAFGIRNSNGQGLFMDNSTGLPFNQGADNLAPTGQWHHFAFQRSGNVFTVYQNGTNVLQTTNSTTFSLNAASLSLLGTGVAGKGLNGYLGALRFTNGVARFSGNFTPSTQPFPVGGASDAQIRKNGTGSWGSSVDLSPGDTINLRMTSSASANTVFSALVTLGTAMVDWIVDTGAGQEFHYFVATSSNTTGGNLGGLTGANSICLSDLQTNDWLGKSNVILDATTVKAFLCDGSTCQNTQASKTYAFALSGTPATGGSTFTTTAGALGPNDAGFWNLAGTFGTTTINFWTGRGSTSATQWANTPDTNTCSSWTDGTSGVNGRRGTSNSSGNTRWFHGTLTACNSTTRRLICMVDYQQGIDSTPDAFTFTDLTGAALSTQYSTSAAGLTGFVGPATASVSGGGAEIRANDTGSWVTSGLALNPGDTINIRMTSSGSLNTQVTGTVTIGNLNVPWNITTTTGAPTTIVLTSGTSLAVPIDWNSDDNSIECIGGGGAGSRGINSGGSRGGGRGGGGGGYSKVANVPLTPGAIVNYQIGAGGVKSAGPGTDGGDSWFISSKSLLAKGGEGGNYRMNGNGGSALFGIGSTKYSGGRGGSANNDFSGGTGGGGAGGPNGDGGNGDDSSDYGGAGGGGNGGGADGQFGQGHNGGAGGNNFGGTGGGAGGAGSGTAGTNGGGGGGGGWTNDGADGGNGIDLTGSVGGGGGGGGGGLDGTSISGNGGLYGGGGGGAEYSNANGAGNGAQGVCVIKYDPTTSPSYDVSLNAVDWANFSDTSETKTLTGINSPVHLEISVADTTGTPTYEFNINGAAVWHQFSPTVPATISMANNDTLRFRVRGTAPHAGTITIRNKSDGNALVDTVVATVMTTTIALTSGSSWTVPSDWNSSNNSVECIGGGGGGYHNILTSGGGGGGGGAYAKVLDLVLTGGTSVSYQIGAGGAALANGTDSWFVNSATLLAKAGTAAIAGGTGGAAGSSIGDVVYSGGNGGNRTDNGGSGGGGAGGPNGAGGNGGSSGWDGGSGGGGNGGGANGTNNSGSNGVNGGNGNLGIGGGSAATNPLGGFDGFLGGGGAGAWGYSGFGGNGVDLTGEVGSGGGGGGNGTNGPIYAGGGGLYGGGGGGGSWYSQGGSGAQGICVVKYIPAGMDTVPDSFDFIDVYGASLSTVYSVSALLLNFDGSLTASVSGGDAQVRKNNTGAWGSSVSVSSGDYLNVQMTSSGSASTAVTANITVGTISADWVVDTTPGSDYHYFVATSGAMPNGDLGGLSGANATCLSDLQANDWNGKSNVTLNSSTVKAFLCDGTTCQNTLPSKTYTFATSNDLAAGGATFTTDGSGLGPNDSNSWIGATYFNVSVQYWSGRASTSATQWANSSDANNCGAWGGTAGNGMRGNFNSTLANRWTNSAFACTSTTRRLVCLVDYTQGVDTTPNAFYFLDTTDASTSTLFEESTVVTGFVGPVTASATNGAEIRANGTGSWVTSGLQVYPGDTINVRMTSSPITSTTTTTTVTVGSGSADWSITTELGVPIVHWKLDETSGTTAADSAGSLNLPLSGSPTWQSSGGIIDGALEFDGVNDGGTVTGIPTTSGANFSNGEDMSFTAWIKPDTFASFRTIIEHGNDGGTYFPWGVEAINQKIQFYVYNGSTFETYATTNNVLTAGVWTHIAVTYTMGTGSSAKIYINGVEAAASWTAGDGNLTFPSHLARIRIGQNGGQYFDGLIDDIRLYDALLSSSDVAVAMGLNTVNPSTTFDDATQEHLTRTPSSAGDRRTWTLSLWVKRDNNGTNWENFLSAYDGANTASVGFSQNDEIEFWDTAQNSGSPVLQTTAKITDTNWHHIVFIFDTTQVVQNDRGKIYVDGVQLTSFNLNSLGVFTYNELGNFINTTNLHTLGRVGWGLDEFFDGRMSEYYFIDGQALAPTNFGYNDGGTWRAKPYTGSFGTNGFYLFSKFQLNGNLGVDLSGNGNNWTPSSMDNTNYDTASPP